jgi:hypothetical protein
MIDPSKQAAIDQIMAQHLDILPDFLRKMYLAFYRAGFNELQALELTKTYLQTTLVENKSGK